MNMKDLRRAAKNQGWRMETTKKGHLKWFPPDPSKNFVIGSGTPSDHRAIKNFVAHLKKSGFIWPWSPKN